ncbi:MAG: hypothetical protein ACYCV7_05740 [Acidimicrobiales bacterium]
MIPVTCAHRRKETAERGPALGAALDDDRSDTLKVAIFGTEVSFTTATRLLAEDRL